MMLRVMLCALLATCVAANNNWVTDFNRALSACIATPLNTAQFNAAKQCAGQLFGSASAAKTPWMATRMNTFKGCVSAATNEAKAPINAKAADCIASKLNTNLKAYDQQQPGSRKRKASAAPTGSNKRGRWLGGR